MNDTARTPERECPRSFLTPCGGSKTGPGAGPVVFSPPAGARKLDRGHPGQVWPRRFAKQSEAQGPNLWVADGEGGSYIVPAGPAAGARERSGSTGRLRGSRAGIGHALALDPAPGRTAHRVGGSCSAPDAAPPERVSAPPPSGHPATWGGGSGGGIPPHGQARGPQKSLCDFGDWVPDIPRRGMSRGTVCFRPWGGIPPPEPRASPWSEGGGVGCA